MSRQDDRSYASCHSYEMLYHIASYTKCTNELGVPTFTMFSNVEETSAAAIQEGWLRTMSKLELSSKKLQPGYYNALIPHFGFLGHSVDKIYDLLLFHGMMQSLRVSWPCRLFLCPFYASLEFAHRILTATNRPPTYREP